MINGFGKSKLRTPENQATIDSLIQYYAVARLLFFSLDWDKREQTY